MQFKSVNQTGGVEVSEGGTKLMPFRVMLREEKGDKFQIAFDCSAEDADHAAEQAENAYPGGEIVSCNQM